MDKGQGDLNKGLADWDKRLEDWDKGLGDRDKELGERSARDGQEATEEAGEDAAKEEEDEVEEDDFTVSGRVPDSADDLPFVSHYFCLLPLLCSLFFAPFPFLSFSVHPHLSLSVHPSLSQPPPPHLSLSSWGGRWGGSRERCLFTCSECTNFFLQAMQMRSTTVILFSVKRPCMDSTEKRRTTFLCDQIL